MPVFSCGGMRYQHKWEDCPLSEVPPENQANLEATIARSIALGINHIETARGYGSSERQLGLVLPNYPREELIVQTKIAPCADPDQFRREFEESLERLRLDHVDLLAMHGINTYQLLHWTLRPGGCLEVARQLVKEGKVRHVGFSTHADVELIRAAIATDVYGGFDYVNLHWYYIFQRNWQAVVEARERDMGMFIISPADKGGMLYKPSDRLIELCQPLHPLVFNCLFCLQRDEVHTLSLGAAQPSDFDLQCSSLEQLDKIATHLPDIVKRLDDALRQAIGSNAEAYLEGLPDWESAPGYTNVWVILWLRRLLLAFDMLEYAQMRYNLLGNGEHWFPGLNAMRAGDVDWSKSLNKSVFADKIPEWLVQTHQRLYTEPVERLSQS